MRNGQQDTRARVRDRLGARLDQLVREWAQIWRRVFIGYRRPHPADRRRHRRAPDAALRGKVIDRLV